MSGTNRRLFAVALAISFASVPAFGDDKDLLKGGGGGAPPNLFIVFGNTQTTTQAITFTGTNFSTFDGDADSPGSKLGAAKIVVRQFLADNHTLFNVGMTSFARPPNLGSTSISQKHWVYQSLDLDFPNDTFQEPVGTFSRWGPFGEGPCTNKTVPACNDRPAPNSPQIVFTGAYANAVVPTSPPFFGNPTAAAYINLDGTLDNKGAAKNSTKRIKHTIVAGAYGDAFTDGTFTALTLGTYSIGVQKEYQTCPSGCTNDSDKWTTKATTPGGSPGTVTVHYRPPTSMPSLYFYPTGATNINGASIAGRYVGFLNEASGAEVGEFDISKNNTTCSGLEFQNTGDPLIMIPRDYSSGQQCIPPQDSYPCAKRLLRPEAYIEQYDTTSRAFSSNDPDNPGYTRAGSKYADGCDPALMGAVKDGLDDLERQVILTARNGSQAPIKGALQNLLDYFTNPAIDGFQNGVRGDDPNASCRNTAVIMIYDTFNGCTQDSCGFLTSKFLTTFKQIGIPIYVIGFGTSSAGTAATGICIAHNSGAILADGSDGYFPVTSAAQLAQALTDIAALILEGQKGFVASTISTAQASGEQMAYLATFNATASRSIWNGRVNGYKLDANGKLQLGKRTIQDQNDPFQGAVLDAPSNDPSSLIWNAGQNLAQTPGTGATLPAAVLAPNAAKTNGTYSDDSNDTVSTIVTTRYPGRKIVFSLPSGYTDPVPTLPIPPSDSVPEVRHDLTATTNATWWPALKALLGPQTAPPAVLAPAITDTDATDSLRFIWGDRDAVMGAAASSASKRYTPPNSSFQLKLGDMFHAGPVLIGPPNEFAYFASNLHDYQTFLNTYHRRRRILFFGANDGLFHAVDAGGWNRVPSLCVNPDGTQGNCYDLGTGAELFAYAPRATMQAFKPLKDAVGAQTKRDEWTADGAPTAADVFIDSTNTGTGTPSERAWHTVLIGGMREGSPFEGTSGASPAESRGSYYALDMTQPDELVSDGAGGFTVPIPATFNAPKCLNVGGDGTCARDWPQILWEISDVGDLDVSGSTGFGFGDMGETWSKPGIGRVRICTANCDTSSPTQEDRYVAVFGGGFDRERLNRRGNWIYMIDIETGRVLYRANSSCGINAGTGGCSPTYFASIPSEPAVLDTSGDGYLDVLYFGDQKGRLWRIDLSDLRMGSAPGSRWQTQIDPSAGSAKPFLVFSAPQPVSPAVDPFFPVYYRPTAVNLGYNVNGKAALGLAFGTGDRDDIQSKNFPGSLNFKQRFYYVVDRGNTSTLTESDLYDITSSTAPGTTTVPANGWLLELAKGERVITDSISINGVIFFTTYNPAVAGTGTNPCGNGIKCNLGAGTARIYRVLYSTGNPYLGSDRGETQAQGSFLSEPVYFQSKDQQGNIFFTTENTVKTENAPGGKKTSVKGWKERSRRP
jgi:Tfp pilus tip-associated adhesin PilY1